MANLAISSASSLIQQNRLEEDSVLYKSLSCIPIIGYFISIIKEVSLNDKVKQVNNTPRLIQLIKVKNDFKYAAVTRNLFSIALLVAGFVNGFFGVSAYSFGITFFTINNMSILLKARYNLKAMQELRTTGFRRGMKVY